MNAVPQQLPPAVADSLEAELLRALGNQRGWVVIPIVLNLAALATLSWSTPARHWMLVWFGATTALLMVRWRLFAFLGSHDTIASHIRLRLAMAMSLVNALAQASALTQYAHLDTATRVMLTLTLIGQSVGAIATSIGYLPLALTYVIPTMGGVALTWYLTFVHQGEIVQSWLSLFLFAVAALALMSVAREMQRVFRDSYEIRRREERLAKQLRSVNAELVAQHAELRVALAQKEQAMAAKTRFLAAASHDMRQPLHAMSLFSAALLNRPLDPRSRQIAACSAEAIGQLSSELDALLDISKLDAGVVSPQFTAVDLCRVIDSACLVLEPLAKQKSLMLLRQYEPNIFVRSDPTLLDRVLRNLVENAIKYTESGRISIRTHCDAYECSLIVSDTGIGIPAGHLEDIFEEFYQIANPERDRARGLGLGLSIVRRLCSLLHHKVEVRSQLGLGSEFSLRLPLVERPERSSTQAAPARLPRGLNVLVVDDEQQVRIAMETLFGEHGCDVVSAGSIEEAQRIARGHRPDIVIADLRLRDNETGVQAIRTLRAEYSQLPAILVTGETSPDRLLQATAEGIRLLHKPVHFELLVAEIASALQHP